MLNINLGKVEATTDNINERGKRIKVYFYRDSEDGNRMEYVMELNRGLTKYLIGVLKRALKMTEYKDL